MSCYKNISSVKILILTFLIVNSLNVLSQKQKTYYIDGDGEKISKGFAKYKREIIEKSDKWLVRDFYLNGSLQKEGFYKDKSFEQKTDTFKFYYLNGNISRIIVYKNDKKHGVDNSYFITGKLSKTTNYYLGILTGKWASYNEYGTIECEIKDADIHKVKKLYKDPIFIGGKDAIKEYVDRLRYPTENLFNEEYGQTITTFQINEYGQVSDVDIIVHGTTEMDSAIINHIQKMPAWKPAIINGKAVSSRFHLPIHFIVNNKRVSLSDNIIAKAYFISGVDDYKKSNYEEAAFKFKRAADLNQMEAKYHYYLGHAYYKIDRNDFACEYWRIANMLDNEIVKKEIKDLCNIE